MNHPRLPSSPLLRERGFTLIEILVVLVIVGIMTAVATLSMGVLGRDSGLEDEARHLWAVITQSKEEIELQGREVGVYIEKDGYYFMRYNAREQVWSEVNNDDLMAAHTLPEGVQFRLWLESREVILKTHQENQDALNKELSTQGGDATAQKKDPRVPQIALLSSGDTTPFELRLEREGNNARWHLVSQPDNTLIVEVMDEKS